MFPLLPTNNGEPGNPDDGNVDVLGEVALNSFTVQPSQIGPFGAAVLNWNVSGPTGFHLTLNSQNVAKVGHLAVQPVDTTRYTLTAHAGRASRTLGSVQVQVDRSTCETYQLANPRSAIEAPVRQGINDSKEVYFRDSPGLTVSFSPGRIRLQMHLAKRQNNFPDPAVNIDASFSLVIHDGTLQPAAEQINVDVSVPFWVWAIPGAIPGLAIAIDMAKSDAYKQVHDMIQGLGQLLNFLASAPQGKRLSTVRVDDGNNGAGIVELSACAHDLLVHLSEVSGAFQVTGINTTP